MSEFTRVKSFLHTTKERRFYAEPIDMPSFNGVKPRGVERGDS